MCLNFKVFHLFRYEILGSGYEIKLIGKCPKYFAMQKIRLAILLIYKFYIPISTFRVSYKATTRPEAILESSFFVRATDFAPKISRQKQCAGAALKTETPSRHAHEGRKIKYSMKINTSNT